MYTDIIIVLQRFFFKYTQFLQKLLFLIVDPCSPHQLDDEWVVRPGMRAISVTEAMEDYPCVFKRNPKQPPKRLEKNPINCLLTVSYEDPTKRAGTKVISSDCLSITPTLGFKITFRFHLIKVVGLKSILYFSNSAWDTLDQ